MIKRSLFVILVLILSSCAGTIKIAKESKNLATPVTTKGTVSKSTD